jgi:hypothetical protein
MKRLWTKLLFILSVFAQDSCEPLDPKAERTNLYNSALDQLVTNHLYHRCLPDKEYERLGQLYQQVINDEKSDWIIGKLMIR